RSRVQGGAKDVVEVGQLLVQQPAVDLVEQVFLGAKVVVEGALGHARADDDLADRGRVVAALREQVQGGRQDPAADRRVGRTPAATRGYDHAGTPSRRQRPVGQQSHLARWPLSIPTGRYVVR